MSHDLKSSHKPHPAILLNFDMRAQPFKKKQHSTNRFKINKNIYQLNTQAKSEILLQKKSRTI